MLTVFKFLLSLSFIISSPHYLEGAIFSSEEKENVKICLAMIVKDDAEVIEKCLNSVKDIVDCVSICDVGSIDGTPKMIEQFMEKSGIPCKIYRHKWLEAGHNRTLSAQAARKTIRECGFSFTNTYLLILDPDMALNISPGFTKQSLDADSYQILEKSSALSYYKYNVHLLRALIPWKSIGVAHEYWSYDGVNRCEKLRTLTVHSQRELSYSIAKLEKDVALLTEALKADPQNARYMFYLAQTYKALAHYDSAIHWYFARVHAGGDPDEVWFSKFMIGECFENTARWDQALFWYLDAYQYNPKRTDPLLKIANFYRLRGQNYLAYLFAKQGASVPYPAEQNIYNNPPLMPHQFDEELSIASYYTNFRQEGYEASDNIILRKNVPWFNKGQAYKNILFYTPNLPNMRYHPIHIELPIIQEGLDDLYKPMNPSVLKTEDGYKVICRTVNYTQIGAKIFNTVDISGIFRTKNFLVSYDKEFNFLSQHEIIENLPRERVSSWISTNIKGLDDCRIFNYQNDSWFTCTTSDTNPLGNFQISLCKLGNKEFADSVHVKKLVPLFGPDPNRCEKNWVPFIKDNAMHVIYTYDPFIMYKPNMETGECEKVLEYTPSHDFSQFRGSAAPVAFDEGYLMVVHEVVLMHDYSRCYLHRFLYLDKDFIVQKVSKPFTFFHQGIEFCSSATIDHLGKDLVLSLGVEDREAYLCLVDLETIRSMLVSLPPVSVNPAF